MNKKLTTFLAENNFTFDGESAYSIVNNYQVSIGQDRMQNAFYAAMGTVIQIFSHLEENQIESMQSFIKEKKSSLHIIKYEITSMGVCFVITKNFDSLLESIQVITNQMNLVGAKDKDYCPVTGEPIEEETKKKLYYNNLVVFLNASSVDILNAEIEKAEEDFKNAPNNYAKGAIGALLGGALGAVVWVVIGALTSFISGWIAFLIAILAGWGYDKMKGKPTQMKFVFSAIATLFYAVVSMFVIYVILVRNIMIVEGIEGNPISVLFQFVESNEEVRSGFITDMVLSLLFGVFGIGFSYFQMKKTIHQKQEKLK